ncbi:MAG: hypothetical protein GX684_02200 [Ruminococcaceae bacterium]|nr:hypothetical protein [Oscillospiraceae bacterium]
MTVWAILYVAFCSAVCMATSLSAMRAADRTAKMLEGSSAKQIRTSEASLKGGKLSRRRQQEMYTQGLSNILSYSVHTNEREHKYL